MGFTVAEAPEKELFKAVKEPTKDVALRCTVNQLKALRDALVNESDAVAVADMHLYLELDSAIDEFSNELVDL